MIETHRVWVHDIQAILTLQADGWKFRKYTTVDGGETLEYEREIVPKPRQRLYAFWSYDLFPYYLGGEVAEILGDGYVQIVGYGMGQKFRPVNILPYEDGLAIHNRLVELKRNLSNEQKLVMERYMADLRPVLNKVLL